MEQLKSIFRHRAGGVSRNTYTQFDVGQEGAILNNSRNNTQTQIGGWVQGNPWLATGEAKVILNEVNSSNSKSTLKVISKLLENRLRSSLQTLQV